MAATPETVLVLGDPKPQKRHRMGSHSVYDPSSADKADFLTRFSIARSTQTLMGTSVRLYERHEPLDVSIVFTFSRPKSHFRTGLKSHELKHNAPHEYAKTSKPDVDNLMKFVFDALNTGLYQDDSQIVRTTGTKRYANVGELPSTRVSFSKLSL
jgi:Holliday junction resolvase RusA-like endonuclease